jgi:FMN phosphatase YigB (HAD superfamily)
MTVRFSVETFNPHKHGWIGFDLDGTLVKEEPGTPWSPTFIGEPVPEMMDLVRAYIAKGAEVRILTARAAVFESAYAVRRWAKEQFGKDIEVTDKKDYDMWCLYDDRGITVERSTGKILTYDPDAFKQALFDAWDDMGLGYSMSSPEAQEIYELINNTLSRMNMSSTLDPADKNMIPRHAVLDIIQVARESGEADLRGIREQINRL